MGLWRRDRAGHPAADGLTHHSGAGSQLTSESFAETLALVGIAASIGWVGHWLFKNEAIRDGSNFRSGPLKTIDDVEWLIAGWVDWCNPRRLHSTLGNAPPDEYEAVR